MPQLVPGQPVPDLTVPTTHHGTWSLAKQRPKHFTMLVFFRGYHCSICMEYIHDLASRLPTFENMGVNVLALSCDGERRARITQEEWHLGQLPLGYGLQIAQAREWGLYISKAIKSFENDIFCEPGMFVIRPNGKLYLAQVQSHPFSRPNLGQVVKDFEYIIEHNYPHRGEA